MILREVLCQNALREKRAGVKNYFKSKSGRAKRHPPKRTPKKVVNSPLGGLSVFNHLEELFYSQFKKTFTGNSAFSPHAFNTIQIGVPNCKIKNL